MTNFPKVSGIPPPELRHARQQDYVTTTTTPNHDTAKSDEGDLRTHEVVPNFTQLPTFHKYINTENGFATPSS